MNRKSQLLQRKEISSKSCEPGEWSKEEKEFHINVLELLAVKLALLTFTKANHLQSLHFQIDNKTALSYLLKMGGTANRSMNKLSKDIWEILLSMLHCYFCRVL